MPEGFVRAANLQVLPYQGSGSYLIGQYRGRTGDGGSSGAAFAVPASTLLGCAKGRSLARFGLIDLGVADRRSRDRDCRLNRLQIVQIAESGKERARPYRERLWSSRRSQSHHLNTRSAGGGSSGWACQAVRARSSSCPRRSSAAAIVVPGASDDVNRFDEARTRGALVVARDIHRVQHRIAVERGAERPGG
jgi:hypothetical protein